MSFPKSVSLARQHCFLFGKLSGGSDYIIGFSRSNCRSGMIDRL